MATDRNDELLGKLHAGQRELLAVLGDIRDRLPAPAPADCGEPGAVTIREPQSPAAPTGDDPAAPKPARKAASRRATAAPVKIQE